MRNRWFEVEILGGTVVPKKDCEYLRAPFSVCVLSEVQKLTEVLNWFSE